MRSLAQAINLASRQLDKAGEERRLRVEAARRTLDETRRNTAAVEQARQHLEATYAAHESVTERQRELVALIGEYPDQGAKEVKKARNILASVETLLAQPLELPPMPVVPALEMPPMPADDSASSSPVDVLLTHPGGKKIAVIKVLREATGVGLKEGKDLVDSSESAPALVASGIDPSIALALVDALTAVGAIAEISNSATDSGTADATEESPAAPAVQAGSETDAIEQIRRLGELRDSGLLTSEEFEGKKAELLSRI